MRYFVLNLTNFYIENSCSHETTCILYFLSTFSISFSRFCLSVLYWFMWTNIVASGIYFLNYLLLSLLCWNLCFLTISLFTISLNFFQSTGTVFNLPTSKSSTFVFEFFKQVGTLVSFSMSSLSNSALRAIKSLYQLNQMYQ